MANQGYRWLIKEIVGLSGTWVANQGDRWLIKDMVGLSGRWEAGG